ncbi:RNA 2',3'-cyclic phosphodiesterase [Candidatus Symbiopectobacterium sp. 'North America']|nr:2'-5' RNA ligase family protein [Candidatus Symbiopectobacterium sp. 'North America']MBG6243767.1 RNA 2',3'-cyclic phosphodiesterase [Candidatus Symbiopectobacterium sp. 'North America']
MSLPDSLAQTLVQSRAQHFTPEAGRPVAAANMHMTLAFLGDVSEQKERALRLLADRIRQAPRGLLQLAALLRSQTARSGCYQSPQPFHPHITLLRGATRPMALPPANFDWTLSAERFALYESRWEQGKTRYQQVAEWPLAHPNAG